MALFAFSPRHEERIAREPLGPSPFVRLAALHEEAEETARLANLLDRSLYAAIVLPVLGLIVIGFSASMDFTSQLVWGGFVALVSVAVFKARAHAMKRPFERDNLKSFAQDISAILLFAGFAWGAGAFLALPEGTSLIGAMFFAAVPAIAVATLLREREAAFLFLAPMTVLVAIAALLRPFADGALAAGAILLLSAAIGLGLILAEQRRRRTHALPAMLPLT